MIVWKRVMPNAGPAYYNGMIGKVLAFRVAYSTSQKGIYILKPFLPSCETTFQSRSDTELQDHAEKILSDWLEKAGLQQT